MTAEPRPGCVAVAHVDPVAARHANIPQDTLTDPLACVDCQTVLEDPMDRHEVFTQGRVAGPLCGGCLVLR